ncbi:MAG TPA: sugar phosphate isomerase/epimerase, partial [Acidobacteriaceae bacterium]|nr:sugar phosphate isomerase/epimerase [Acidobacteriaceae bacterium]
MSPLSRRTFLTSSATAVVATSLPALKLAAQASKPFQSVFRVSVISDEISQDFDHACSVIANDFGLQWVELRGMWDKNIMALDGADIAKANAILDKYKLRVTDIASPLFKVDWPEA